jgi:branched-chain amino acid aminotransferase
MFLSRTFSTAARRHGPSLRWITSSQLTVERTTDPSRFENRPPKEELQFGTTMSDHMLTVEWTKEGGWEAPKIIPYQDLRISPASSCLHYGA